MITSRTGRLMLGHKTRVKMKIRVNHSPQADADAEAIAGPSEPAPSEAGPLWGQLIVMVIDNINRFTLLNNYHYV